MAIKRVEQRVLEGGHNIAKEVIRRRYLTGISNLKLFTSIVNYWLIIDNSTKTKTFIAEGNLNKEKSIFVEESWNKIIS